MSIAPITRITRSLRRGRPAVSRDLLTFYVCCAAALAATGAGVWLATGGHWLAAVLVLWLVPSLLLVGVLAHRVHTKQKGRMWESRTGKACCGSQIGHYPGCQVNQRETR